jgi:PAS domain S-box-containing protein
MNEVPVPPSEKTLPFPLMHACPSAAFLQTLILNSPIAIVALDSTHCYRTANPAFLQLFGYTEPELLSTDFDEQISTRATRAEACRLSAAVLGGEKVHAITRRRRKDATLIDVEIVGIPLIEGGRLEGVYGLYQDLTERLKVQDALRATSERLHTLQEAVRGGALSQSAPPSSQFVTGPKLTRRELYILNLLASGRTSRAIASSLDISVRTVESHRTNINQKCGFRSFADLVRFAISHHVPSDEITSSQVSVC